MAVQNGNYSSWTVIEDNMVIKHCDLTVLRHGLTTIDKHIAEFWGVENLSPNKETKVVLKYEGNIAEAPIKATNKGQRRLYLPSSIRKYIRENEAHYLGIRLYFKKSQDNSYLVTPTIQSTNTRELANAPLTTIVNIEQKSGKRDGARKDIYTTIYERNPQKRKEAIKIHGLNCAVCGFNFEQKYGDLGKQFIEVHHVKPLHSLYEPMDINPRTDLVCLCSNCHSMIHHKKGKIFTIEELRDKINDARAPQ